MNKINMLAISGSLRENSSSGYVINAFETLLPENVVFKIYKDMALLPHFDGNEDPQETVIALRKQIAEADAVLICTPEYVFGVPGSLKNLLDWTVSSGDFVNKPVALITASTSGEKAHESLLNTLTALSAKTSSETNLLISFIRSKLDGNGQIKDDKTLQLIKELVGHFLNLLSD